MADAFTTEMLNSARDALNRAARNKIARVLEGVPKPGHRTWDSVYRLARIARDLDSARTRHTGHADRPHGEWETMPRRLLEKLAEHNAEALEDFEDDDPLVLDLAEQVLGDRSH